MKTRLTAATAAAAISVALAACGSSSTVVAPAASSTSSSATTSTATGGTSTSDSPSSDTSTSSAPAASGTKIAVGTTVTDDILDNKVTVVSVIRNFPIPAAASAIKARGDELVLVEVKVTAGSKYYAGMMDSDFTWGVQGKQYSGEGADSDAVHAAMTAAGHPPLAAVDTGKSGTGWIAGFLKPAGSDKAYVALRRVAAKGSDGTDIPKKEFPVTLPLS